MEISYKLEAFEGPLDLLLHLIEKDKINIYDIPIAEITAQYMEYVAAMQEADLDVMSEFLVMAATLLDIKARMLLPKETDPETGEEIDPREELVTRLVEYRKFRVMAQELKDLEFDAEGRLFRAPDIPKEVLKYEAPVDLDALLSGLTADRLREVFEQVMRRKEDRQDTRRSSFGTIRKEKVSIGQKLGSLLQYAGSHKHFSFRHVLEEQPTRLDVVVTFLAVLELTKLGRLRLNQGAFGDDLEIEAVETEGSSEEFSLEGLEDFET